MSTRINQETIEIVSTGDGNVRLNQEAMLVAVNAAGGNVRLNQAALLCLTPAVLVGQKVQIVGGPFQDALGNPLSNGYLLFKLQHDAVVLYTGQVVGNVAVKVPLDVNGYIQGTTVGNAVYIWPNNVLYPAGNNYLIWAYDSSNRQVWDNPQVQTVNSTPNPYSVNVWVPGP